MKEQKTLYRLSILHIFPTLSCRKEKTANIGGSTKKQFSNITWVKFVKTTKWEYDSKEGSEAGDEPVNIM